MTERIWRYGWDLAVAWARLLLAIYILTTPIIVPTWATVTAFQTMAVVASPFVPFRFWIVQQAWPFVRKGYWAVVALGPLFAAAHGFWFPERIRTDWPLLLILVLVYEVAAIMLVLIYAYLWRLGDTFLAPSPEYPRRVARAVAAGLFILAASPYVHAAGHALREDACLDAGGRFLAQGAAKARERRCRKAEAPTVGRREQPPSPAKSNTQPPTASPPAPRLSRGRRAWRPHEPRRDPEGGPRGLRAFGRPGGGEPARGAG